MKIVKYFINGEIASFSEDTLDVFDPSKGEVIRKVVNSNSEDFDKVIESSVNSQKNWSRVTPLNRSRILQKYKILLEKNIDSLAEVICEEHGKTYDDAKGSLVRGIEVVEFASGIPHLLKGDYSVKLVQTLILGQ